MTSSGQDERPRATSLVENAHVPESGDAPAWTAAATAGYRGYFENRYGEQWIVHASRDQLRLTGGDIGWETIEIANPDYPELTRQLREPAGSATNALALKLVLNEEERLWLHAICTAVAQDGR